MRVNIGCGRSPTMGWLNYDNSISVLLAKVPGLPVVLNRVGLIARQQREFMDRARSHRIGYANAVRRIPLPDGSVDVLYSSHMIEHLDRIEAISFLTEARRVLSRGGIIRIACPDLRREAQAYLTSGDADAFVKNMHICQPRLRDFAQRLRFLVAGPRRHQWMYDGESLCKLLVSLGFTRVSILPPGRSTISDPGPLDLRERADKSVYVEAVAP